MSGCPFDKTAQRRRFFFPFFQLCAGCFLFRLLGAVMWPSRQLRAGAVDFRACGAAAFRWPPFLLFLFSSSRFDQDGKARSGGDTRLLSISVQQCLRCCRLFAQRLVLALRPRKGAKTQSRKKARCVALFVGVHACAVGWSVGAHSEACFPLCSPWPRQTTNRAACTYKRRQSVTQAG